MLGRAAEIADLNQPALGNQNVVGLEVPVEHAVRVQVEQPPENLEGDLSDQRELEGVDDLVDVVLQVYGAVLHEDQVLVGQDLGVVDLDHVLVVQLPVDPDFTLEQTVELLGAQDFLERVELALVW